MEEKNDSRPTTQFLQFSKLSKHMQDLIKRSVEARKTSYSPYSKFPVGAAVLCENNEIYSGCNVENVSFGLTVCAEQTAIVKAVSDGNKKFKAIAVSTNAKEITTPCGKCRQFICEFGKDVDVYCTTLEMQEVLVTTASQLLPFGFQSLS